jgi:hypothetical protein
VPKVTVDYGDGRRLVGTVTGNSVHYLLDPSGRLVDALPGLATPDRFLAWLRSSSELAHEWARLDDVAFAARLRDDHRRADQNLLRAVHEDLRAQGWNDGAIEDATELFEPAVDEASDAVPTAAEASRLALTKAAGEAPLLTSIGTPPLRPQQSVAVVSLAANEHWKAQLSREARGLVAARAPETVRTDLAGALERMGQRLAEDGVRNEVFLHRRIHAALAKAQTAPRWQDFNAWVYATLFLTPASDPWLGLAPTEALWGLRVDTGATSAGAAAGATGGR